MNFNTIVFFDVETTGLIEPGKNGEPTDTRITELCFIAISREHFLKFEGQEPRILRKLVIPVNPLKPIKTIAAKLTGLTNVILQNEHPMNEKKVNLMRSFFEELPERVCLIAHNGLNFDFRLLKNELRPFPKIFAEDVGFADSLKCFKELQLIVPDENADTTGKKISYSLPSLYKRMFGSEREFHKSEEDAMALLKCCAKYNEAILDWVEDNYVKFEHIKLV